MTAALIVTASEARARPLRPAWLRPFFIGLTIAAHVGLLTGLPWLASEKLTPLDDIQVELVAQGETVTETATVATPEAAPVVTPDQAVLAAPELTEHDDPMPAKPAETIAKSDPVPDLALPAPKVEAPEAPALPEEKPKPDKVEKTKAPPVQAEPSKVKDTKRKQQKRMAALRALKRAKAEAHARQLAAQAQLGAPAVHAGVKDGTGTAARMSNAAYAALVSADINRHKHYPAYARERGTTGSASVVFSVGPSGAIVSHTITRSSGNGAIDAEVHQMMVASHPPPPPGGRFRGSVAISFNLGN